MADRVVRVYALRYLQLVEQRALRRERVFRDRTNAFDLHDRAFKDLFRLSKECVRLIIDNIQLDIPQQEPPRRTSLTVETMVLAAVRFYATGSYQRGIGQDLTIALSQRSVSKCVVEVSKAISEQLLTRWIKFPRTPAELLSIYIFR